MKLLLSTGAFIGKPNQRNFELLFTHWREFACDGFEFMIYSDTGDMLMPLARRVARENIPCPVVHAQKRIAAMISTPSGEYFANALDVLEGDCIAAQEMGAKKIVLHIWDRPFSNKYMNLITSRYGMLHELCAKHGLLLCAENTVCYSSPLAGLEQIAQTWQQAAFTIDVRPAQFHREVEATTKSQIFTKNMAHVHVSDIHGEHMQWSSLRPILQPGDGDVDFVRFFAALRAVGYDDTITMEASSMREDGVDAATLNRSLQFVRDGFAGKKA